MQIKLDLSGSALRELPEYPQRLRRAGLLATKRMAEDWVEAVHDWIGAGRAFTPRTGQLEQSIAWRPTEEGAEVFANAAYAPYVEWETRPHVISPRSGRKALRFAGRDGGFVLRRSVRHPGTSGFPFMFADIERRTDTLLASALRAIGEVLAD